MLTCIIRYDIDPTKRAQFEHYARTFHAVEVDTT